MIHELKIKPEYFAAVVSGDKTFEIRNNADRNFSVGDTLLLWEWDGGFTGQTVERAVSYITDFEQKPGYVVLGLANKRDQELADQLADATRQCGVIAELLREQREGAEIHLRNCKVLKNEEGINNWTEKLSRIDAALAGKFPLPAWYLDGAKDFKSMMLEASTALFHPHIEGVFAVFDQRLALDAQPQGGEQIVKCPHCNAEFQDGSDAAEFIGWHGLCSSCELKGGEPCDSASPSSSPD